MLLDKNWGCFVYEPKTFTMMVIAKHHLSCILLEKSHGRAFVLKRGFIFSPECILEMCVAINKTNSYFFNWRHTLKKNCQATKGWSVIYFLVSITSKAKGEKKTFLERGQFSLGGCVAQWGRAGEHLDPGFQPLLVTNTLALALASCLTLRSQFLPLYKIRNWIQMKSKGPSISQIPTFCFFQIKMVTSHLFILRFD